MSPLTIKASHFHIIVPINPIVRIALAATVGTDLGSIQEILIAPIAWHAITRSRFPLSSDRLNTVWSDLWNADHAQDYMELNFNKAK